MGKSSLSDDSNGVVALGTVRPDAGGDGQGSSGSSDGTNGSKATEISSQENISAPGTVLSISDYAATPEARAHAFRLIYSAIRRLSLASQDALAAVKTAEGAGLDLKTIVQALRLEHSDWQNNLEDMMNIGLLLDAVGAKTSIDLFILTDTPLAKEADKLQYAESDGYLSAIASRKREDNPHVYKTKLYHAWLDGFKAAVSDIQTQKNAP